MNRSVQEFRSFYARPEGRLVRQILGDRIRKFWPDVKGMRVLGYGYATPYLRLFLDQTSELFALMPAGQGAHGWPPEGRNRVFLAEETELPLETASVDRVIVVHGMEFAELAQPMLQEIWRVLKSNGRLLIVVPNRRGFWAGADWSPFGQGTPYTLTQISKHLGDSLFVHERTGRALFMPPVRSVSVLRSLSVFEGVGSCLCPAFAGVHLVEASKLLYAGIGKGSPARIRIRGRGILAPPEAASCSEI